MIPMMKSVSSSKIYFFFLILIEITILSFFRKSGFYKVLYLLKLFLLSKLNVFYVIQKKKLRTKNVLIIFQNKKQFSKAITKQVQSIPLFACLTMISNPIVYPKKLTKKGEQNDDQDPSIIQISKTLKPYPHYFHYFLLPLEQHRLYRN